MNVFLHVSGEHQNVIEVKEHIIIKHIWITSLISAWKTAGALERPKGMTKYLKHPKGVLNGVFHSSPSLLRTRDYHFTG